jgi:uncharacterized protein (TIGR03067 family)
MYTTLFLGLAATLAAPAPKDTPKKKEAHAIVGSWSLEKAEAAGMVLPGGAIGELSLTFSEDGAIIARKGGQEQPDGGRYTHDAKKSPAEIDLTEGRPGGKDMMVRGIYKIDGDTLVICMTPTGERPTKFESPAGAQTIMMTFKRIKKD